MNLSRWLGVIGLLVLVVVVRCGGSASPHDPVRIRIPAIGVDASVQSLTVDQSGVLPPPDTYDVTGWWREGPEPGERGPAACGIILLAHRCPDIGRQHVHSRRRLLRIGGQHDRAAPEPALRFASRPPALIVSAMSFDSSR